MAVIALKVLIGTQTTVTTRTGDQISSHTLGENLFRAQLLLTPPEGDHELEQLGDVQLQVQADSRGIPDLSSSELIVWLCKSLQTMLDQPV